MDKITRGPLMPEELKREFFDRAEGFVAAGYPVEMALKEAIRSFCADWRKKYADQSGG